jgi:hypothetical protein
MLTPSATTIQVAKWGQAFEMKVLGFDPVLPAASFKELGIKKADLDKIWPHVRWRRRGFCSLFVLLGLSWLFV